MDGSDRSWAALGSGMGAISEPKPDTVPGRPQELRVPRPLWGTHGPKRAKRPDLTRYPLK